MAVTTKKRITYGKQSAEPIQLSAPAGVLNQQLVCMRWNAPTPNDIDRLKEYHPVRWNLSVACFFTPTNKNFIAVEMEDFAWHLPGVVVTPWFEGRIAQAIIAVCIFPKIRMPVYLRAEFTFAAFEDNPPAGAYHSADVWIIDTEEPTIDNSTIGVFGLPSNTSSVPYSKKHIP